MQRVSNRFERFSGGWLDAAHKYVEIWERLGELDGHSDSEHREFESCEVCTEIQLLQNRLLDIASDYAIGWARELIKSHCDFKVALNSELLPQGDRFSQSVKDIQDGNE